MQSKLCTNFVIHILQIRNCASIEYNNNNHNVNVKVNRILYVSAEAC